eukprot:9709347-Prorocentrum_lima.AAC.1
MALAAQIAALVASTLNLFEQLVCLPQHALCHQCLTEPHVSQPVLGHQGWWGMEKVRVVSAFEKAVSYTHLRAHETRRHL